MQNERKRLNSIKSSQNKNLKKNLQNLKLEELNFELPGNSAKNLLEFSLRSVRVATSNKGE